MANADFYMNVYINVKTRWWCQLNIGFQILPVSIFEKFYFLEIFSKFQLLTVIQNNILTSSGYVRFFSFIYFLNQMWRSILIILSKNQFFVINFHYIRNFFINLDSLNFLCSTYFSLCFYCVRCLTHWVSAFLLFLFIKQGNYILTVAETVLP